MTRAAALGLVEWLPPGAQAQLEAVRSALQTLAVQHLRFGGPWTLWAQPAHRAWYDELVPLLAAHAQLLPCCWYVPGGPGGTAYADFLEEWVGRYGAYCEHVEIWDAAGGAFPDGADAHAHSAALGAAAYALRRLGKKTVVSGVRPAGARPAGAFAHGPGALADVIGLRAALPGDARPWSWHVEAVRKAAQEHRPAVEIWITAGGREAGPADEFSQVGAVADLAEAPVARAYWHTLCDAPGTPAGAAGAGLIGAGNRPKLAWRLWAKDPDLRLLGEVARWSRRRPARRGNRPEPQRPALITGGAGFLGTNLAQRLAARGRHVRIADSLARPGVEDNLRHLMERYPRQLEFVPLDVRDRAAVAEAVDGVGTVFHLAAQVAVTTSLEDPRADFEVNLEGTLNLLEALRARGGGELVFASTNKVYGDLADVALVLESGRYQPQTPALRRHGIAEDRALEFHSPYGCSKGGADQYVLDYGRCFGLRTLVLRMSCIYGPHQYGTEDQGWVAHFARAALAGAPICLYGDGHQVRDVLYVTDAVEAYLAAERALPECSGQAFNLGGGPAFAVSLREVVAQLEAALGREIALGFGPWRAGDQRWYVSDTRRFQAAAGWRAQVAPAEGLARLVQFLRTGADGTFAEPTPSGRAAGAHA